MKVAAACFFAALCFAGLAGPAAVEPPGATPESALPLNLRDTGLYRPGSTKAVDDRNLPFSPQYPLWSDGSKKQRWIYLPPGTAIDASDPDAWEFPPGTRFWKEFSAHGETGIRPIETRLLERLRDGSWRYASYAWNEAGTEALLAPPEGLLVPVPGGTAYRIPSRADCAACHEGSDVPVLGFGALQLSPDRDPLAPHAEAAAREHLDLRRLAALGRVRNLPQALIERPPRIAAASPTARAALGYLHGNCGNCHNRAGALAGIELVLAQSVVDAAQSAAEVESSLVGQSSRFRPTGAKTAHRILPGGASVLTMRMRTTNPFARMPPLGVSLVDAEGVAMIEKWIQDDLQD